jgi:hypothetical protein
MSGINRSFDSNGIQKVYETKVNGKEIYQPVHSEWTNKKGKYEDEEVGWIEERYKKRTYRSGGWSRGAQYQFTKTKSFVNQEVTVYVKIRGDRYDGDGCGKGTGFSTKVRGGPHNDDEDSAGCYIFHHPYKGGVCGSFQKEKPHNDYWQHETDDIEFDFESQPIIGKWVGIKSITWNERGGVNCEMWIDYGGLDENDNFKPKNEWRRWYLIKDTGNLRPDRYPGDTKDPFTEANGPITQFRLDSIWKPIDKDERGEGCELKYASIRQLDDIPIKLPLITMRDSVESGSTAIPDENTTIMNVDDC